MNPIPTADNKINTNIQIAYLRKLFHLMIGEELKRPLEPTARSEGQQLVRRLPVICERYINPESVRLKALQESTVAAMASSKDNPWFVLLQDVHGKDSVRRRVLPCLPYPVQSQQRCTRDPNPNVIPKLYHCPFYIHLLYNRQKCVPVMGSNHRACVQKRR